MKKLFYLLTIVTFFLASCGDKDDPKPVQKKWDANKMVMIKPDRTAFVSTRSAVGNPNHLSPLEIVKQGEVLRFYTKYFEKVIKDKAIATTMGFAETQKDFTIPALKMWGTTIINQEGEFVDDFIMGSDFVVTTFGDIIDTIAYIPNKVIVSSRDTLRKAYDAKHYEDVYQLFDKAFTFRPITGAEWRALKAKGEQ